MDNVEEKAPLIAYILENYQGNSKGRIIANKIWAGEVTTTTEIDELYNG